MPAVSLQTWHWHCAEIALLKIYNDLLRAAGRGELTALCQLDLPVSLSAAFETAMRRLH